VDNHFPKGDKTSGDVELFNLDLDSRESRNVAAEYPKIVAEGYELLETIQGAGNELPQEPLKL